MPQEPRFTVLCCTHDPEQYRPGSQVARWRARGLSRSSRGTSSNLGSVFTSQKEKQVTSRGFWQ